MPLFSILFCECTCLFNSLFEPSRPNLTRVIIITLFQSLGHTCQDCTMALLTALTPPLQISNSTPFSVSLVPFTHGANTIRIHLLQLVGFHFTPPMPTTAPSPSRNCAQSLSHPLISAIRHAIRFAQTSPRLGVLRLWGEVKGSAPHPVKKRC